MQIAVHSKLWICHVFPHCFVTFLTIFNKRAYCSFQIPFFDHIFLTEIISPVLLDFYSILLTYVLPAQLSLMYAWH